MGNQSNSDASPAPPQDVPDRPASGRLAELHPRRFFLETWRRIDREAAAERALLKGYDFRPLAALAVGAACLTLMEYYGSSHHLIDLVEKAASSRIPAIAGPAESLQASRFFRLAQFVWWAFWRMFCYVLTPALLIKLGFRERLRDYGLSFQGVGRHLWIWALCYCPMLMIIVAASFRRDFVDYYPFYEDARRSWFDLLAWELLYASQFLSLEFFFRGFWLKSCKTSLGSHAIFVMVVPYCMIHFGKPWPEVLGAILAGIILGTLAFKTRSIWIGFLIHESVALSMDLASLVQTGGLPSHWWPT